MEPLSAGLIRKAQTTALPFAALPAIAALREHLDNLEEEAVHQARAHGGTWGDIAEALGITRQALQQRMARRQLGRAREQQAGGQPDIGRPGDPAGSTGAGAPAKV